MGREYNPKIFRQDQITEESIRSLVNRFYAKVRNDEDLGPVFQADIGDRDEDWWSHLQIMYDFCS